MTAMRRLKSSSENIKKRLGMVLVAGFGSFSLSYSRPYFTTESSASLDFTPGAVGSSILVLVYKVDSTLKSLRSMYSLRKC